MIPATEKDKLLDGVKHRLDLIEADIRRITQTLEELSQNLVTVEENSEQAVAEISSLESRLHEIEAALQSKFRTRDEIAQAVDRLTTCLDQCRGHVRSQDDLLRKMRENQELEMEGERRIELEVAKLQGELNALLASARNQYAYELDAADFIEQHPYVTGTETNAEMIQDLKQKIERLGPVNLLAIEEYEKENTRLDGLLEESKRSLGGEEDT